MAKKNAPGLGLGYGWNLGESGTSVKEGLDTNFLTTSVLVNLSVKSRVTTLPGGATDGDRYLVPSSAGSNANAVAARTGSSWTYFTPKRNWEARVEDEGDAKYVFNGTAWVAAAEGALPLAEGPLQETAALTEIVQTPANSSTDKDFLSLTIAPGDVKAGMVFDAMFFGTQSQAAVSQNLIFYVKINDGAAVTVGEVGAGAGAQNYRAISGKAIISLLTFGANGTYALGGELMINGLSPYSSTSASSRAVDTTTGFKITLGVRNSVANEASFENISGAFIRRIV